MKNRQREGEKVAPPSQFYRLRACLRRVRRQEWTLSALPTVQRA